MTKPAIGILAVLAIIYAVPFAVYAAFSSITGLQPPEGSPVAFLTSVLVSKVGTAIAFVSIFHFARPAFSGKWLLYAGLWWAMFVIGEIGQAIAPAIPGRRRSPALFPRPSISRFRPML